MTAFPVSEWSEQLILMGAFWDFLSLEWIEDRRDSPSQGQQSECVLNYWREERTGRDAETDRVVAVFICSFGNMFFDLMIYSTFSPPSEPAFLPRVSLQVNLWVRYKTEPGAPFQGKQLLRKCWSWTSGGQLNIWWALIFYICFIRGLFFSSKLTSLTFMVIFWSSVCVVTSC